MAVVELTGPRSLQRYLLDGERVVVALHQHWAKAVEPVLTTAAAGLVALWIDARIGVRAPLFATIIWYAWFVVVARMLWLLFQWRHDWFVATDKRLMLFYGLLTTKVAMMPLPKVTDMSYVRSPGGRVLGYGMFVLESAGQDQALREIKWVPSPDHTYRVICAEIFGVPDHIASEDEQYGAQAGPQAPIGGGGPERGSSGRPRATLGARLRARLRGPLGRWLVRRFGRRGDGGGGAGGDGGGGAPGGSGAYRSPVQEAGPRGARTAAGAGGRGEAGPGGQSSGRTIAGEGAGSDWSTAIPVHSRTGQSTQQPGEHSSQSSGEDDQLYLSPDLRERSARDADTGPIPVFRQNPEL